jgi:uncharacterized membrane protein YozB (DUF420 family)
LETAEKLFPHINASLNAIATILLAVGYALIKGHREHAHKWTMLSCFAVSVAFLCCYLYYHIVIKHGESTRFPSYPPAAIRIGYLAILLSHVVLAAAVPFLAGITIYFGLRDQRQKHLRLARWTFPIWLYVSVTGVLVYWMLYHLYPPLAA